ncbi:hypothetical protein PanWU01x14_217810 [Parasponia andersonii]|uniref:Retroviral polymerase SH3-like domain-containing protein n=1 Tax=Parasponia andersonii TaxID=3476 RepID=A0A2P5BR24_PARAD|nr:hypothetical protein PanWU01x14_217810 [Parasponia andersonii]
MIKSSQSYIHLPIKERSKLNLRALKCIFLGYSPNKKGYKCFHPPTKKYFITMDVKFFEHLSYYPKSDLQGEYYDDKEDLFYDSIHVEPCPNFLHPEETTN